MKLGWLYFLNKREKDMVAVDDVASSSNTADTFSEQNYHSASREWRMNK